MENNKVNDNYFSHPGLSKSGLVKMAQSPAHFKAPPKPKSPQQETTLNIGTAFHCAVLEPDKYDLRFDVLPPEMNLTTKAGKELKAKAEAAGKILLKYDDHQNIQSMALAVRHHPGAKMLIESPGPVEEPVYFKDPMYGFDWKIKPDKLTANCMIPDLKSTADARFSEFQRTASNLHYHWSAFLYLWGMTIKTGVPYRDYLFIVVERDMPYGVMIYFASHDMLLQAACEIAPLRKLYADCLEKDQWPAYPVEPQYLELPRWAKMKDLEITKDVQFLLEGGTK
jgi:exodeoxyribonuclease VIII